MKFLLKVQSNNSQKKKKKTGDSPEAGGWCEVGKRGKSFFDKVKYSIGLLTEFSIYVLLLISSCPTCSQNTSRGLGIGLSI